MVDQRAVLILTLSVLWASFNHGATVLKTNDSENEIKNSLDNILDGTATDAELESFFESHKVDEKDRGAFDDVTDVPAAVSIVSKNSVRTHITCESHNHTLF